MKREKKPKFVDDGRTIASMDYEHITGYKSAEERRQHEALRSVDMTKQEKRALYRASMLHHLVPFACFVVAITAVCVIFYFIMR